MPTEKRRTKRQRQEFQQRRQLQQQALLATESLSQAPGDCVDLKIFRKRWLDGTND